MVLSSRSAAKATLALNAGLCERRERRPDDFLFITNSFRLAIVGQAICPESVFISAVQICGATSLGYGPVSAALYKTFDADGFVTGTDYVDLTYSYSFTEKIGSYVTVTKSRDVSSLGVELGASYDLGNNLSASATYEKDATPKFVLGLTKSF
jgi:hypothetical protein